MHMSFPFNNDTIQGQALHELGFRFATFLNAFTTVR